ncbi:MAG: hypothetical protein RLZZ450_892 [Pseudomonadota bacterium]|jgi:hypothetical protein
MATDGSMLTADQDLARVVEPSDRRPDFTAEALSPGVRLGLLAALAVAVASLFAAVLAMGVYPNGLLDVNSFFGVMAIGGTLMLGFFMLVVFGALLANNPRLSPAERNMWYVMFALAGPVALPVYWFKEVWPVPFEPSPEQRL